MYATVTLYRMLLVGKIWTGLGNGLVTCSAIDYYSKVFLRSNPVNIIVTAYV